MTLSIFQKIDNQAVAQTVISQIEQALVKGELKPGDQLPSETEMAQQLGIARATVREAFKALESLGVLEIRRGQGTFISDGSSSRVIDPLLFSLILDRSSAQHLLELRRMFEIAYTELAIEHASDEDITKMDAAIEILEEASKAGKQSGDMDLQFHRVVLESTKNPLVIKIGQTILDLLSTSIDRAIRDNPQKGIDDHKLIRAAIAERDVEKARSVIQGSFSHWQHYINLEKRK